MGEVAAEPVVGCRCPRQSTRMVYRGWVVVDRKTYDSGLFVVRSRAPGTLGSDGVKEIDRIERWRGIGAWHVVRASSP